MGKLGKLFQGAGEDRLVAGAIVGWAKGAAHRMIDEDRPRRGDYAHDVVGGADHQRRNALAFDDMGDETDGLMAERSVGHEQGEIDLCLL